jgi:hypothetical protein
MTDSDRPEDDTPAAKSQRKRRRPPVLELEATEVGSEATRQRASKPSPKSERESQSSSWAGMFERLSAFEWRISPALIAGVLGAVAGSVAVLIVVLLADRSGDPRLDTLAGEVASISAHIETLAKRPAAGGESNTLGERIDRLAAAIAATEKRIAALDRPPPQPQKSDAGSTIGRTVVEATLDDLRKALADLRRTSETASTEKTPAAIEALTSRIGALENHIAALTPPRRTDAAPSLATEIAALNALDGALKSGKPFVDELAAARTVLGERAASLAALEQAAVQGLPTTATLVRRFAELAPLLVRGPGPEGSLLTRLWSNAGRLVEVRPIGEPEGTGVGAVVARMETKLNRGDLIGALEETALLPAFARTAAAEWIAIASRRRDAEIAIKNLTAAALAAHTTERTQP